MSTALATIDASELETMQRTAKMMMASGFFGGRGEEGIAQIAVKIMAGREMGYGPFASVRGIHVIQGTPALSANLMAAAVKGSGRYDYRVRKMDDSEVTIEFFEIFGGQRDSLGMSTFTLADARKAQTKNLDKFARNMLFARAMSNGVRWFCPDVFSGNAVYVPEELGADVDGETGEIIQGTYKTVQAMRPTPKPEVKPAIDMSKIDEPMSQAPWQDDAPIDFNAGQGDAHADDGSDNPFQPAADAPRFTSSPEAHKWAIEVGACANVHEALASFKKIVATHFDGKLTPDKVADACDLFVARQLEKLNAAA